jgi:hypothetical protein
MLNRGRGAIGFGSVNFRSAGNNDFGAMVWAQ